MVKNNDTTLLLSELSDDVEISIEGSSTVYTVAQVKHEIQELGEEHHLSKNWYTISYKRWYPSANTMIERYIESEYADMYEDWDERANECITEKVISKIQKILDKAFNSDYATTYWTYDNKVEIDIFPNRN